jgi:glycosyltransferase involved in cell wall biosynthesis
MPQQLPTFSIVIPTRERPKQLAACLASIASLDYPRDAFEVVVVDDGSTMSLQEEVAPFSRLLELTFLRKEQGGPASARNAGAAKASGELLAFTDDDCLPAPDWLRCLAARLSTTPRFAIGGQTINALLENRYSAASQLLIDYLYSRYNTEPGNARFLASSNLALTASDFNAVGGFDPAYAWAGGEDRDFCNRWVDGGRRLIYAAEARVYHAHDLTLRSFWRQHFTYGRGAAVFRRLRALRADRPVAAEPLAFYCNLIRAPFLLGQGSSAPALVPLLLLSQAAVLSGLLRERVRFRFRRQ